MTGKRVVRGGSRGGMGVRLTPPRFITLTLSSVAVFSSVAIGNRVEKGAVGCPAAKNSAEG